MFILDEHQWPFYDPDLDKHLVALKNTTESFAGLDPADLYGALLDADVSMRECLPFLPVAITTRHAASLLLGIGRTLDAINAYREEDVQAMSALLEIAEDFKKLSDALIYEIKHGAGTLLVPIKFAA